MGYLYLFLFKKLILNIKLKIEGKQYLYLNIISSTTLRKLVIILSKLQKRIFADSLLKCNYCYYVRGQL